MSDEVDLTTFRAKVEERRRREEAARKTPTVDASYDDLVPDEPFERSDEEKRLDEVIARIDILLAYRKWIGKKVDEKTLGRREGVKVSCPKPTHPDKDPSAWLNLDTNLWFCGGCQEGGDVYDIAAYGLGIPVPGYKDGANFHELRRKMAESFGYTFLSAPGLKEKVLVAPEPNPQPEVETAEGQTDTEGTVVELFPDDDDDDDEDEIVFPTLDWRKIVPPDTFLDIYMQLTCEDDIPEEYNFWNAMVAIGMTLGREVTLADRTPVYGNLFVCLLGHTGDGKTRSFNHLRKLLNAALPHKWDDEKSKGTYWVSSPGSAEYLIHAFSKPIPDPSNPKIIAYYAPVRGLVEFNELSSLIGRTSRMGNVMKPTLMEMYDCSPLVSTASMTHGRKEAHEPYCSVFTTSQPRALKRLLGQGDSDSGFLNRWIFASGKPKQRIAIGGRVVDIEPAVEPLKKILGWTGFGKTLEWSPEAVERFSSFFHETLYPAQKADDSGLLTRMDLLLKKLILLLCANIKADVVPVEIVDLVIGMYDYLIAAYAIPSAQIGNNLMNECHEELQRHIRRLTERGTPPTQRDLGQRMKRKKYPLDLIVKVLKYMADLGEIEVVTVNAGKVGRPSIRYKYVS